MRAERKAQFHTGVDFELDTLKIMNQILEPVGPNINNYFP